ncbi:transporter substrate-binding domain-containing protein [Corynebacterium pyruviciproducens]|uniref:transporter substrate-binding domain-containing protein n=2 Tax=Corynebacterium pyruviciproducens TaxID=598660 RepID=UPI00288BD9EE|nr:transporter substrate-binding domain-containing protein [Corynebacterium pyruviciproducens]
MRAARFMRAERFVRAARTVCAPPVIALALLAAGCASEPQPAEPLWNNEELTHNEGLPQGAEILSARDVDQVDTPAGLLEPSLRPVTTPPPELIPEIYERGYIIVGVEQSQNLMSYRDLTTGELIGFEIDLAHEIARDIFGDPSKVAFRYVDAAGREAALSAPAGARVDMVIRAMTMTRSRADNIDFSAPYFSTSAGFITDQDSTIDTVEELDHATVCVAQGSINQYRVARLAPDSTLVTTLGWSDCLMALQQQQVDAVFSDTALLAGMAAQDAYTRITAVDGENDYYGIGIKQGNDNLTRQVNKTVLRIIADGTWRSMFNRWFGQYLATPGPPAPLYAEDQHNEAGTKEEHRA